MKPSYRLVARMPHFGRRAVIWGSPSLWLQRQMVGLYGLPHGVKNHTRLHLADQIRSAAGLVDTVERGVYDELA